ncbi:U1 small nuclear ribonucleoprotein C-like [Rutidosis leptorrhynchoides]|uniref:U1 small nuclear ribonucleoprotein C-like n=1 Tax=Rutidosis leptorrhynchoides TaxID=125765 RepID=UPI003A9A4492
MPRYYCDYCDTYLTHDSPSVRKQHNAGYKHKGNVRTYYQQYEAQQNQYLIDQKVKEHLGQAAAFQQFGAAYNPLRPRPPVLPNPMMMPGMNPALMPGMRPPISLPRPPMPGYPGMPQMLAPPGAPSMPGQGNPSMPGQGHPSFPGQGNPSMPGQGNPSVPGQGNPSMPGGPSMPGQAPNGVPRPMPMNPQMMPPGSSSTPTSGGPPMFQPHMYQANPTAQTSGGFETSNVNAQSQSQDDDN